MEQDLNDLKTAFLQHEAVCEERWRSVFHEIREAKEESRDRWDDLQNSVGSLHRLIWAGGGAVILFLAGMVAAGNVL